ncbi:28S ribosomal protein S5, mitochondrial [Collichthys lucidus]|uniref:Small ribosomal subunit protein uS5m n=1 Tax=Collichthys lucidus TaxID=240159 RepID=A0A4U5VFU5_COLLU|nr:28S ribosomal protein S5, mitochondrial [Collichthys lucidus]
MCCLTGNENEEERINEDEGTLQPPCCLLKDPSQLQHGGVHTAVLCPPPHSFSTAPYLRGSSPGISVGESTLSCFSSPKKPCTSSSVPRNGVAADQEWQLLQQVKGRGKRTKRKLKRDLNRGQSIGEVRQRDEWERKRKMKVKRERGWTGRSWGGISLGPPDPGPNGETYEGFDSRVIEVKTVFNMTAKEGRKRSISCLVAVGNGNGAAGFALGKAAERNTALRKAKNRAIHYLYYIERYNDSTTSELNSVLLSTVYHDIESKFKRTTLRMKKQNKGYGLHCHRAVITLCKLIGIKDMYCKVEGSVNLLNITRALFTGLATQETHQALADKKQLHVVEFQAQRGPLPVVVASPKDGAQTDPEPEDEIPNTRLHWSDVQAAQGTKRSIWAGVKRTIW